MLIVGTAGWGIPAAAAAAFAPEGSGLERYASRFAGVEINSSFYRPHRPSTWARWAASVPGDFRFAVKIPKTVTHVHRLIDCADELARFCDAVAALGPKLAVLLVQLPPSLAFAPGVVADFFGLLASLTPTQAACEPRHASWFDGGADELLARLKVARVAADPARAPSAGAPGGWDGLAYWRLHGSPLMYRSPYGPERIAAQAEALRAAAAAGRAVWCMFDNTTSGAATSDALMLRELLDQND